MQNLNRTQFYFQEQKNYTSMDAYQRSRQINIAIKGDRGGDASLDFPLGTHTQLATESGKSDKCTRVI